MASVGSGELQSANIFIPQEWSDAADTIAYDSNTSPAPVALVCGPKNSGKTTLSRLLVNVLLQRYLLCILSNMWWSASKVNTLANITSIEDNISTYHDFLYESQLD